MSAINASAIKLTPRENVVLATVTTFATTHCTNRSRATLTLVGFDTKEFCAAVYSEPNKKALGALLATMQKKGVLCIDKELCRITLTNAGYDIAFGPDVNDPDAKAEPVAATRAIKIDDPAKMVEVEIEPSKAEAIEEAAEEAAEEVKTKPAKKARVYISEGKGDPKLLKFLPKAVRQYVIDAYRDESGLHIEYDPLLTPAWANHDDNSKTVQVFCHGGVRQWYWDLQKVRAKHFRESIGAAERRAYLETRYALMMNSVLWDLDPETVDALLDKMGNGRKEIWHGVIVPQLKDKMAGCTYLA